MKAIRATVIIAISVWILQACNLCCGPTPDERAAAGLAGRIVPQYAGDIVFCQTEDSLDVFELSTEQGRLVVRGNNANSMATGLNHYLKNFCDVTVSWYATDRVQCPDEMPVVAAPVRVEARTGNRFFLNYCTFGYTMPWWKWEDWERFIDWMALNGVNMPLANTGQEAIWQNVWRRHGLTDEQIRAYFTGPAHLPWHRMSNIDHFDGPLPQNWIDAQARLQKKILKRERELNMKPVLSAFNGHVPEQLKDIYPDADRDTYRSLVVTAGTQAIGNHSAMLRDSLTAAYRTKDLAKAERISQQMMETLADLDALTVCDPQLRLDRWLADASACARTQEEAAYYRRNARTLITTWGLQSSIRDYATRVWSGLTESYYAPRWQMYCDEIKACIKEDREYDQEAFFKRLTEFEDRWAAEETPMEYRPATDYMELSRALYKKYFTEANQ